MWMTSCTGRARGGFLGFWRKCVRSEKEGVTFTSSQRTDEFTRYGRRTRWGGGRWKSQNRKNVYLSPYVEEPLNSKVIKSFVPELRSCKCFSCFGIPMFYVIYEQYMYVSHICIRLWYRYKRQFFFLFFFFFFFFFFELPGFNNTYALRIYLHYNVHNVVPIIYIVKLNIRSSVKFRIKHIL